MTLATRLASRAVPQLEVLRIGLGLALLSGFVPLTPHLSEFYGDEGWASRDALAALHDGGRFSVLTWCRGPALALVHAAFIALALAFTAGWHVRWVKWPLWILYVSYLNSNPALVYGVDQLLASLLLLVCVAPVGRGLVVGSAGVRWPSGSRAAVCLALVRWQMSIVFLCTALQKLRGELWWSGEAVWVTVQNVELANTGIASVLAHHFWLVNTMSHGALAFELTYPFLIWGSRTRRWMIGAAILFHAATAALFGLYLFACVAIVGHFSFLSPRAVHSCVGVLRSLRRRGRPAAQSLSTARSS